MSVLYLYDFDCKTLRNLREGSFEALVPSPDSRTQRLIIDVRLSRLTLLQGECSAALQHGPEPLARGRELALGHPHRVGDVLVEEALVAVQLLRPLAVLRVHQRHEVPLVPLLPLSHAGHPLHCKQKIIRFM